MDQFKTGKIIAAFLIPPGVGQLVTIIGVFVVFFYAVKFEVSVGVYKYKERGEEIIPPIKR